MRNWVIAYRDKYQLSMARKGSNLDETYALSIFIFELPAIETEDAFLEYIKDGRKNDTDSKRFDIVKDEVSSYSDFSDFCVKYHSITLDKDAKKISKNKDPMALEMAGYVCRHPNNKNIGVNFDFSHRYYKGNEDVWVQLYEQWNFSSN